MVRYPKYATTVIGAHSEPDWYDRLVAVGQLGMAAMADAQFRALRELGYRVLEVRSGDAALDMLDRHDDVDLLFTDIVMPGGLNGRQLADEALRRKPGLRVLFTTGYTRRHRAPRPARSGGAVDRQAVHVRAARQQAARAARLKADAQGLSGTTGGWVNRLLTSRPRRS
jgi:CheY-like chemotaxis protein